MFQGRGCLQWAQWRSENGAEAVEAQGMVWISAIDVEIFQFFTTLLFVSRGNSSFYLKPS